MKIICALFLVSVISIYIVWTYDAYPQLPSETLSANVAPTLVQEMDGVPAMRYVEAPLPTGWVEPEMVLKPQLSMVPAHRTVEGSDFRSCFKHIQANDIPMTAPVYMEVKTAENGVPKSFGRMRFLYPDKGLAPDVVADDVEIIDVESHLAVTIHMMGAMTDDQCLKAYNTLVTWCENQTPRLVPVAEPVVLGYNSPFVLPWKKMWELQLRVEKAASHVPN